MGKIKVTFPITFSLDEKDKMIILGENGCGKSEFLKEVKQNLEDVHVILLRDKIKKVNGLSLSSLSSGEKVKKILDYYLDTSFDVLMIDGLLDILDSVSKKEILSKIEKHPSIILVVSQDENIIYSFKKCMFIKEDISIYKVKEALLDEKIFKQNNVAYPFMADLSNKLSYYSLLEKPIYDIEKMVNTLWK